MKQTRRSGTILGNKPDLYCSPLSLKGISCWTKQTSSKVAVEQSAVGTYESVTRHWNQSQDTRNTLTLKPVAVNSALLDSNKEGYLLVSHKEGYLLVSRKEAPAGFSLRSTCCGVQYTSLNDQLKDQLGGQLGHESCSNEKTDWLEVTIEDEEESACWGHSNNLYKTKLAYPRKPAWRTAQMKNLLRYREQIRNQLVKDKPVG
ncbi:zinc finger CCCH domain-containing protein 18-like [Dorcoceras hygrometricum]|uniref:Zinc finger CCCH domain-containing protein 18-like n=1 Tax=Dorcoceras hygrometricum TaxID=472368 RepID=A0A2Z7BH10_9LAMI|nr:zinc finger CCCH domain-containing protein 18-like [Dorcoceras hygrometricum]